MSRSNDVVGVRLRLYIAGPMTGLPEFNYPAFSAAEKALLGAGYYVESPHRNGAGDTSQPWQWYVRLGLVQLLSCDAVALLPDWEHSRGACVEHYVARALGMDTRPLARWLAAPPTDSAPLNPSEAP